MNGYAGKIARIDLTKRKITVFPTSDYEQWVGGHGMGSAIFWDLVKDKTIDGFDPANVMTLMTSPLSGTLVPAASGRTEVQAIGVQSYPIGWFTRGNFGGRFSPMLKFAGWDGIVLEGKADTPVWIDIRDNDVQIRECKSLSLWGKSTWDCQKIIWDYVAGGRVYGDWFNPEEQSGGRTTQRPAVLAIGPAGENMSRLACLIHDASNAAGQGGFGALLA
jgi:aldehyde:ferredoxin oxidoreductase